MRIRGSEDPTFSLLTELLCLQSQNRPVMLVMQLHTFFGVWKTGRGVKTDSAWFNYLYFPCHFNFHKTKRHFRSAKWPSLKAKNLMPPCWEGCQPKAVSLFLKDRTKRFSFTEEELQQAALHFVPDSYKRSETGSSFISFFFFLRRDLQLFHRQLKSHPAVIRSGKQKTTELTCTEKCRRITNNLQVGPEMTS